MSHARPQPPQLRGSDAVLMQAPPQQLAPLTHLPPAPQRQMPSDPHVSPDAHGGMHAVIMHVPPTHDCPDGHARPQPPQSVELVARSTHRPEQQTCPPVQAGPLPHRQLPAAHALPEGAQLAPQRPQCDGSLVVSTHRSAQHARAPAHGIPPELQPVTGASARPESGGVTGASNRDVSVTVASCVPQSSLDPPPDPPPRAHASATTPNATSHHLLRMKITPRASHYPSPTHATREARPRIRWDAA
ncbi:MAG: hypothetical protein NZ898_06395 [Myxococcota bacterium]|nr:hypothetical protein [Myxococcota bacterium]